MEVVKIIICDDEISQIKNLSSMIRDILSDTEILYRIDIYTDGEALLNNYKSKADLIFLDIEMPLIDGLETARLLREKDEEFTLAFTTSHEQYAVKGYDVAAWRYYVKPINKDQLTRDLLPKIKKIVQNKNRNLFFRSENSTECISMEDICYIETAINHKVIIHTIERNIQIYKNMNEVERNLDSALFFRCHTSYIVGFRYIKKIDKNEVIMKDNNHVPLSKHRRREFLDAFMNYAKELF
ncbi:MAG: LytR/AlgR family response regulator transcription factor [Erysipelotrichaceae bacterium]